MYQSETRSIPSGFDEHRQQNVVPQESLRLGIVAADHLVDPLNQLLCAEYFAGVQPAVDPDDRLPFLAQARAPAPRSDLPRARAARRSPGTGRAS